MNKKFAIVLALALIAIVCCAGCIDSQEPVDPVDPVVPVDPVDPVTPIDPVVPAVEYSVFFMLNYGEAGAYSAETVTAGDAVAKPTNPTRSGYTFKGWFTAAEGGAEYDFTQAVNADLTLYAQWKKKSSSGSGHSHSYSTLVETVEATCGAGGYDVYKCSCGDEKNLNPTSATGDHALDEAEWIDGKRTCSVCQYEEVCSHPSTELDGINLVCTECTQNFGEVIAKIGTNYYTSFESAINDAGDNAFVTLLKAVTSGTVTKNVVIDTNKTATNLNYAAGLTIKINQSNAVNLGTVKLGDDTVYFEKDAENNYVAGDDGNLIIAYTVKDSAYTVYTDYGLEQAFETVTGAELVINLAKDITIGTAGQHSLAVGYGIGNSGFSTPSGLTSIKIDGGENKHSITMTGETQYTNGNYWQSASIHTPDVDNILVKNVVIKNQKTNNGGTSCGSRFPVYSYVKAKNVIYDTVTFESGVVVYDNTTFTNCIFSVSDSNLYAVFFDNQYGGQKDAKWELIGCSFTAGSSYGCVKVADDKSEGVSLLIKNCTFEKNDSGKSDVYINGKTSVTTEGNNNFSDSDHGAIVSKGNTCTINGETMTAGTSYPVI